MRFLFYASFIVLTIIFPTSCDPVIIEGPKADRWVDIEANYHKQKSTSIKLSMNIINYYMVNNKFPPDSDYISSKLADGIFDYLQSRDGHSSTKISFFDRDFKFTSGDRFRGYIYLVAMAEDSNKETIELGFCIIYVLSYYETYVKYKPSKSNDYLNWDMLIGSRDANYKDIMSSDGFSDPILFINEYYIDNYKANDNMILEWR